VIPVLAAAAKALGFLAITVPLMPMQRAFVYFGLPQARKLPHLYHRLVCRLLGLQLHIEGDPGVAGLIVANHASWLDIPVLSATQPLSFIAKMEVYRWPFFGTLARLQQTLFVDRDSRITTGERNSVLMHRLQHGETLVLFPEGTSHNGRSLKPFKSAFFAAVEKTNLPLIPVTLVYARQHGLPLTMRQRPDVAWYGDGDLLPHLWGVLKGGPISVKIIFHQPLHPQNFASRKELAKAAENLLKASLASSLHGAPKIG
jgi:1-acyl-sn-glycerol-3-phosphate acyltransferase